MNKHYQNLNHTDARDFHRYSRRNFLKLVTASTGAGAIWLRAKTGTGEKHRPNVIILITDDQGYGDLSCHGNPIIQTPNLDCLHAESVRLTNFHVDPTCAPTRAALLTGRYSHRVKVWHTFMGRNYLRPGEVTMAELVKQAGYRTGHFGKWHLGGNYPFRSIDRGFDSWVGHGDGGIGTANDYWGNDRFNDTYQRNGKWEKFQGFCTDIFFAEAMKFIKASKNQPFFVYLATNVPHTPCNLPKDWVNHYRGKTDIATAYFFATITRMDLNLGRLRQFLQDEGLDKNTILVYLTDNGTSGGDLVFNAGRRAKKGSVYDGGHRVPCFIHWPDGQLAAGKDIDRLTAHIDILPTLIDLCNLEIPGDARYDGQSLVPLLKEPLAPWPDRALVVESQRIVLPEKWKMYSVMTDRWRLVNSTELYDMLLDPGQQTNVAPRHPDVVKNLCAVYENYWNEVSFGDSDFYNRIIIGARAQPETLLSCHDWIPTEGRNAVMQTHILAGRIGNGYWIVEFARKGTYRFELRRWPRETKAPIAGPLTAAKTCDTWLDDIPVSMGAGKSLPIRKARLKVNGKELEQELTPAQDSVVVTFEMQAGPAQIQSWFIDKEGNNLCGSYYLYVRKL